MRRALLVGIDHYPKSPLAGCINDALRMHDLLQKHHDGSPNFDCRRLISSEGKIPKKKLKGAIDELLGSPADCAVLFFAGHGTVNNLGGYLVTPDAAKYDEGVSMTEVLSLANSSPVKEVVIVLDCCHSGALGGIPALGNANDVAVLRQGVSVLSACRETEYAMEAGGGGLFTALVADGLNGGAADVCGKVKVAAIYAYVDEALGAWQQRPLFKAHVSTLVSLRTCAPAVPLEVLRLLPGLFPTQAHEFQLDPSYEPSVEPRDADHEAVFGHLQKFRSARLLVPIDEEHLYFAAIKSKRCKLTSLGRFYWHLANNGKL